MGNSCIGSQIKEFKKTIEFNEEALQHAIGQATVEDSAVALFGLHSYGGVASKIAFKCEDVFLKKLQQAFGITLIERTENTVKAYYFIDLYDKEFEVSENVIHNRKLRGIGCPTLWNAIPS